MNGMAEKGNDNDNKESNEMALGRSSRKIYFVDKGRGGVC